MSLLLLESNKHPSLLYSTDMEAMDVPNFSETTCITSLPTRQVSHQTLKKHYSKALKKQKKLS